MLVSTSFTGLDGHEIHQRKASKNLRVCSYMTVLQAGMLAPDGRCKALDNTADGYVRTEACGVLLLRLAADMEEGSVPQTQLLLWGCSVNQDGRSSSLTAPNGPSQQVRSCSNTLFASLPLF